MRQMKDSGVFYMGPMNAAWRLTKIGFMCQKLSRPFKPEDTPLLCTNKGRVSERPESMVGVMVSEDNAMQGIHEGDIAIHGMDTWHGAIGLSRMNGKITRVVHVCDSDGDNRFVVYYLQALAFRGVYKLISNGVRGNTSDFRSWDKVKDISIAVPTLPEQTRICDFLDDKCAEIDALTADVQMEIETLQEYRRSLITKAVTKGLDPVVEMKDSGNIYLGQINSQWEAKRIKYLFTIRKDIAGYEGPTVLSITQRGIRPKNLTYGEGQQAADYSGYQLVSPGDFAMNHMDLLTGWVDISNQSGVTSPDYRVFRLRDEEQNNKRYFLYVMQMCYTNRIFYQLGHGVSGMGRWRLPTDRFLNFIVPVPSKTEQKKIATFLDEKCTEIDSIIEVKQKQLETLAEYRKSLIYEYVTGKKEVV